MRIKTYGPANDSIPTDEMFTAKIIQNAKARSMELAVGAFYRDRRGIPVIVSDAPGAAVQCCAFGSAMLEWDTAESALSFGIFTDGNDLDQLTFPACVIGRAYRNAMGGKELP